MLINRRKFLFMGAGGLGLAGLGAALGARADRKGERAVSSNARMPTAFVPHGGGPWPVLKLPMMDANEGAALAAYMRSIAAAPPRKPDFLVVISAHWEAAKVTVHVGGQPDMYYDYGGFPPEAYELRWPAPGAPERGQRAVELLRAAGFEVATESGRGFDHGTFIPLMLAYPEADVPVVQVSLKRGLDPEEHLTMGRALAPLRDEGGYIIGSGNSYHNLRKFFRPDASARRESTEFDSWLNAAVQSDAHERQRMLTEWQRAPAARACHPREEHLIPLMVAAGAAADDPGRVVWQGAMGGMKLSAHHFG